MIQQTEKKHLRPFVGMYRLTVRRGMGLNAVFT